VKLLCNHCEIVVEILLSLGANLGERETMLHRAIALLGSLAVSELRVSSLYETAPVGFTEQPAFLNCAVFGTTNLAAEELFRVCKDVELTLGRTPRPRWHEREIDIDIVLYGTNILHTERLTIPHPHVHERRFVLVPVCEIAPQMQHPVFNTSMDELLRRCADTNAVTLFLPTLPTLSSTD
jgi:2-amino-4-hydroxy-6-hydroxymethyldihydropteridine diphosphokinase